MPRFSKVLTRRQQEVLSYIRTFYTENGICPSSRQIQHQFGLASQTGAMSHIDKIVRKGYLTKCPHSGRIIIKDERIPWEDVKPLLHRIVTGHFLDPTGVLITTFFQKYPHLRT